MKTLRSLPATAAAMTLALSALLVGCSSDDGETDADDTSGMLSEDDSSGDDEDTAEVLKLEEGASLTLPGANNQSEVVEETPFTVAFDTMACESTFPKAAIDYSGEAEDGRIDLVADEGNQICIVELAATNDSKGPGTFSSSNSATLRTDDGYEYSEIDKDFDDQGWLHNKDREPSYTTDQVQPGTTKYDVIAFELPSDKTPVELVYDIVTYEG